MKKLLMVVCFVVSMVSLSKAQGGGGGGRGMGRTPEDQLKNIQTAVPTLTADQSAKLLVIFKASTATRDSLMKAGADRSAMRPMMQAQQTKVQAVLTDEQKAVYTKYMADMRAKMQQGGMGGGGGTPPPPSEK
jgi:periplasmic protein CpxP/Spy